MRTEAGQSFIWVIVDGKLARHVVTLGRRDEVAGLVEVRSQLPGKFPALAALLGTQEGSLELQKGRRRRQAAIEVREASGEPDPRHVDTKTSIRNPVFAIMVMVGITVLGVFSYNRLRVSRCRT